MSGIAGIYNLDDRSVEASEIETMLNAMPHRKVDGQGQWISGAVGLGHGLLHTTPESFYEHLPLTLEHITITANARIDNRDALLIQLGVERERWAQMPDPELMAHAYLRWGADCAEHLLGDFAFVIWDSRENRLFCARDHFGLKPFFYYRLSSKFIFASEIKCILAASPTPPCAREATIIERMIQGTDDKTSTFLENIYRLPPAHTLICDAQGNFTLREYWKLDPEREIQISSFEEYVEQFRELLTEAVRCRLRTAVPLGSTLSGGLDSSVISTIARNLLREHDPNFAGLPVFSINTPDFPSSDERYYQDIVINSGGFQPHFLRVDQTGPLVDLVARMSATGEPIQSGNEYMLWLLQGFVHQSGVRVLLNGYDGDSVVSHGDAILREWTINRDWDAIGAQIQFIAKFLKMSEVGAGSRIMDNHVFPTLEDLAHQGHPLDALQRLMKVRRYAARSNVDLAKIALRIFFPNTYPRWVYYLRNHKFPLDYADMFSEDVIRRYHLRDEAQPHTSTAHITKARDYHYRQLTSSFVTLAIESEELQGAAFQLDVRSPFCDIRLMEFNLAAPVEYKLYQGWPRSGLRAVMKGIVPEEVRTRTTKGDYLNSFQVLLKTFNSQEIDIVRQNVPKLMPFIKISSFERIMNEYFESGNAEQGAQVWIFISICLWFYHMGYIEKCE